MDGSDWVRFGWGYVVKGARVARQNWVRLVNRVCGEELLGVAGLVAVDGVGGEALVLVGGLDAEDGVAGGEGVADGVAGGLDFGFEGLGAGRYDGVGAVGSELFLSGHTGGF
jgi:hypothetical protein